MNRSSPAQVERARRWLAHAGGGPGGAEACAAAAGQVYDKLHSHLSPLLGAAGVQALFVRSAKLAQGEFVGLDASCVDSSTKLQECLQAQDPTIAMESAVALFATFLALLTTFIGERLTTETLRGAWPTLEATAQTETKK